MTLDEIQKLWTSDCTIDDSQLDIESIKIPELHNKYLKIFSEERLRLVRMESKKKSLQKLKWLYYTGKIDKTSLDEMGWETFELDLKSRNKEDLNRFIDSDNDLLEMQDKIEYQKEKMNYLETIVKSLVNRGYLIKNAIDWKKFTMGA
jgi:hypothetical protein